MPQTLPDLYAGEKNLISKMQKTLNINLQIQVYMFKQGEACADFVESLAVKLAIVGQASNLDNRISKTDKRAVAIRNSIHPMQTLIYSNSWDTNYAKTLDDAIDGARQLLKIVNPFCLNLVQVEMRETL